VKNTDEKVLQFCLIQLQILKDKESRIRKELLDYRIQKEFLNSMIDDLRGSID
tara:strand:+ start:240 stop:398 length:159 start_codon:yes stop_codon:yes gene_type:complete